LASLAARHLDDVQVLTLEPRRLRRLIRQDRHVGGFGRDVPHAHGYVLVEGGFEQLVLPDDGAGPALVWRRIFSLAVFATLMRRPLTEAATRARLHALGQTELDEIRVVLRGERRMLPPKPNESPEQLLWALFGALWSELAAFDAAHLAAVFPTLAERRGEVDALIARDVDVAEVLAKTRPDDAPARVPVEVVAHEAPPSQKRTRALAKLADAERRGDAIAAVRQAARAGLDVHARDAAVRISLRSTLTTIVEQATPRASSQVERIARAKLVEELLDRLVETGRIDFPSLRDAVARNQAKLADLAPADVIADPLLVADRRLAAALPGHHRKAELYRNALHRTSALLFGTPVGRWLTKLVLIPSIGAFALLLGLQHTVGLLVDALTGHEVAWVSWPAGITTALLVLALVNSQRARDLAMAALHGLGRGLHALFVALPRWLVTRPLLRAVVASRAVRALWRFVLEPALVASLVVVPLLLLVDLPPPALIALAALLFAVALFVLRSPLGERLEDGFVDTSIAVRRAFTEDVVPAIVLWVIDVFKRLMDLVEAGMHAVEERLRARPGDSRNKRVWLRVVAVPWFVFAYIVRLVLNVFIEPKYNLVKHFPAVTVGHKLVVAFAGPLVAGFEAVFSVFGPTLGHAIAFVMVFELLPGAFGFFAWELKENWRLYAANRARHLVPVPIGSHGETMRRLLRPGFHSGTLPKVFKKLRRARSQRLSRYRRRRLDKLAHERAHIAESIERFITREVLAFDPARRVARVELASNRVRVHLDDETLITFEEQSGLVLGDVTMPAEDTQPRLCNALAGAWAEAGVDYLRADLERRVGHPRYDIDERGLVDLDDDTVKVLSDLARPPIAWCDWVARWG